MNKNFQQHALKLATMSAIAMGLSTIAVDSYAANVASASANASPVAAISIALDNNNNLNFGKFVPGTGGTISVNAAGGRSVTGAILPLSNPAPGAARFNVTGDVNASYSITLPSNGTVILSDGATHTMAVDNFVSTPAAGVGTGNLGGGGSQQLSVGATLTVANGQVAGNYTANFNVTVDYN